MTTNGRVIRLRDLRDAEATFRNDPQNVNVPDKQWWYNQLFARVLEDPTLMVQLDVGPQPGTKQDMDSIIPRFRWLFVVQDTGRPHPYCGLAGALAPLNTGKSRYRVPLFASIATLPQEGGVPTEADIQTLALAYQQLAEYLMADCGVRGVEVLALPASLHTEALVVAEFLHVAVFPAAAINRRRVVDVHVYTKG